MPGERGRGEGARHPCHAEAGEALNTVTLGRAAGDHGGPERGGERGPEGGEVARGAPRAEASDRGQLAARQQGRHELPVGAVDPHEDQGCRGGLGVGPRRPRRGAATRGARRRVGERRRRRPRRGPGRPESTGRPALEPQQGTGQRGPGRPEPKASGAMTRKGGGPSRPRRRRAVGPFRTSAEKSAAPARSDHARGSHGRPRRRATAQATSGGRAKEQRVERQRVAQKGPREAQGALAGTSSLAATKRRVARVATHIASAKARPATRTALASRARPSPSTGGPLVAPSSNPRFPRLHAWRRTAKGNTLGPARDPLGSLDCRLTMRPGRPRPPHRALRRHHARHGRHHRLRHLHQSLRRRRRGGHALPHPGGLGRGRAPRRGGGLRLCRAQLAAARRWAGSTPSSARRSIPAPPSSTAGRSCS